MNKSESKYYNTAVKFDKALLQLLEQKPFEYITVSELCREAGVNRSTFYLHYETTCDLLEETSRYVLDGFLSCFSVDSEMFVSRFSECALDELNFIQAQYLHPYLSHIRENRRVFAAILSHPGTFGFDRIFQRMFDSIFNPVLERFNYPSEERKYVMMFYLNGITAVITEWIRDGCRKSIEDISEIIRCCIFGREI